MNCEENAHNTNHLWMTELITVTVKNESSAQFSRSDIFLVNIHSCLQKSNHRFVGGEVTDSVLLPFLFLKLITTHITKTCAFLTSSPKLHVCSTPISSQIIWSIVASLLCNQPLWSQARPCYQVSLCHLLCGCVWSANSLCHLLCGCVWSTNSLCHLLSGCVWSPNSLWKNNNSLYVHRLTEDLSMCMS